MTEHNDFAAIDKLVEFGLGMALAQQMVKTMNMALTNTMVPGTQQALRSTDQQQFFVVVNNAVGGPWSRGQVQASVLNGSLPRDAFVWTPGMAQWAPMGDVGYFTAPPVQPPPLPPRGNEP